MLNPTRTFGFPDSPSAASVTSTLLASAQIVPFGAASSNQTRTPQRRQNGGCALVPLPSNGHTE